MKKYEIHWMASGKVETVIAANITEALAKLGHDSNRVTMKDAFFYFTES